MLLLVVIQSLVALIVLLIAGQLLWWLAGFLPTRGGKAGRVWSCPRTVVRRVLLVSCCLVWAGATVLGSMHASAIAEARVFYRVRDAVANDVVHMQLPPGPLRPSYVGQGFLDEKVAVGKRLAVEHAGHTATITDPDASYLTCRTLIRGLTHRGDWLEVNGRRLPLGPDRVAITDDARCTAGGNTVSLTVGVDQGDIDRNALPYPHNHADEVDSTILPSWWWSTL